jgi:hypothetical protein
MVNSRCLLGTTFAERSTANLPMLEQTNGRTNGHLAEEHFTFGPCSVDQGCDKIGRFMLCSGKVSAGPIWCRQSSFVHGGRISACVAQREHLFLPGPTEKTPLEKLGGEGAVLH